MNPKGIAERLNSMADEIIAIRGNCDSEVLGMSDTPNISNRGNAVSKTSVTDNPKISNRGNYAAKTSVFDSPKISERGHATIPAKEYNDNITNRSISVFDNNTKYDEKTKEHVCKIEEYAKIQN